MFLSGAEGLRTGCLTLLLAVACGARSSGHDPAARGQLGLLPGSDGDGPRFCEDDETCATTDLCQPRICVDGLCAPGLPIECPASSDPCLSNQCEPSSGECRLVPSTPDADGDGFRAPLTSASGGAERCGDDCDDSSVTVYPGAEESCDGRDNDCDGATDEGFSFAPDASAPVWISVDAKQAGIGGLLHNGELFIVSYAGRYEHNRSKLLGLSAAGEAEFEVDVALTNSDTYAGPARWTGDHVATVWEDRRDQDYEIYFNRFDERGNKLAADLRLTQADDFSINPAVAYSGTEYLVFWQDRRDSFANFQIYAQRVGVSSELLGDNINVTPDVFDAEAPAVAVGNGALGVVFNAPFDGRQVMFQSLDFNLERLSLPRVLSPPNAVGASVTFNSDEYVVAWHEYTDAPGDAIWGSVVAADGSERVAPGRITEAAAFARGHTLLALGDRLLLLWAAYEDGSYDLFMRELANDLAPLSEATRITHEEADVVGVTAAIGDGVLGVLYTTFASGSPQVYFTTLACSD